MSFHVGGFGLQGISGIPAIDIFLEGKKEKELIVNGICGFYSVLTDKLGKNKAYDLTINFVKKFEETLKVMERSKTSRQKAKLRHCIKWSNTTAINTWDNVEEFVESIRGETKIISEVLDLEEKKITKISGKARDVALSSIAMPGLFPPFQNRYITTTFFSQIPVSFLKQGDTVLVNLRNLEGSLPDNVSDIIGHSLELKAINLAEELLKKMKIKAIIQPIQIRWENMSLIDEILKEIRTVLLKELSN